MKVVRILGIESSCDETAAAVVEDGEAVLSSVVASQMATHGKYGGVVPELASREHLRAIVPVVREALERAGDAAGGSRRHRRHRRAGPGGIAAGGDDLRQGSELRARRAADRRQSHRRAHPRRHSGSQRDGQPSRVSGAGAGGERRPHAPVRSARGVRYRLLGKTRDDAAGEAFDKVAKLLGFGYPGGPVIDRLAPYGDPQAVRFTFARMKGNALDFSFSGLKTAVLRWVEARGMEDEIAARRALLRGRPQPTARNGWPSRRAPRWTCWLRSNTP